MSDTSEYTVTSSSDDEYKNRSKSVKVSNAKKSSTKEPRNLKRNLSDTTSRGPTAKTPRGSAAATPKKRCVPLKPDELFVDWANDQLISHSRWGQDKLYRYLPVVEMDKLVGWATHMNTYQSASTIHGEDNGDLQANSRALPKSTNNPLLGLPNLPLRPSLLKHLVQDPATKLAATNLGQTDASKSRKRSTSSGYFERFQHSAAVAVGMLAEDMITASLLPLARQHVARCRQHDHVADWTLPPEEAIYKLFQDSEGAGNSHCLSSALLTSRIPTRSTVPGAVGTSILNQPRPGVRAKLALDAWCRSRDVDLQTLCKDDALLGLLVQLPRATVPQPRSVAEQIDPNPTILDATVLDDSNHFVSYEI